MRWEESEIINRIVDALFPKRCPVCHDIVARDDGLICRECNSALKEVRDPYCIKCGKQLKDAGKITCTVCSGHRMSFDEGRAVFLYDDIMRKSIYRFKYGGRQEYAVFYASRIYSKYKDKIKRWNPQVIIPVPVHKSKIKKRGYNQAYLIAKELSRLTKIPVDNQYLKRAKETKIQKNLGAFERESNLKNAFKISPNGVQYLSAMLIDDIYTTGATLNSASVALKDSGISCVYCMSLSIGEDF